MQAQPEHLVIYQRSQVSSFFHSRAGETKVGQALQFCPDASDYLSALEQAVKQGVRYVLVGIPEQIGPMANLGKGGADTGWEAFLSYFLNMQSNSLMTTGDVMLLGRVDCNDLHNRALEDGKAANMRVLCAELDERVNETLQPIFAAQLIPIVIGGGHNNAYPIIKSCSLARSMPLAVANMDPHSDFRQMEGRHSGNPFRYAVNGNYLERYAVLGLHEQKNSEHALQQMQQHDFLYFTIQQILWRRECSLDECIDNICKYLHTSGLPVGIELDLDAISNIPSSAVTACGLTVADALYYVHKLSELPAVQYLHLAEGAPALEQNGQGERIVGQVLAELVSTFIKKA